jgi:hypothetical protein
MVGDKMVNPLARENMRNYLKKEDIRACHSDKCGGTSDFYHIQNDLNLDNKEQELIQNIIQGSKKTNRITLDELVLRIRESR